MYEYYPLLVAGALISTFATVFILAYVFMKNKKEAIGFDRDMKDSVIIKRMLKYAKPHAKSFALVLVLMIFSISHEILSPIILGQIVEMVALDFELNKLFYMIVINAVILCEGMTAFSYI